MYTTIRSCVRWLVVGLAGFGYLKLLLSPSVISVFILFSLFCYALAPYTIKWHKRHTRLRLYFVKNEMKSA